jgi:hypothetical protein
VESQVIFRDRQELQSADLNNLQDFTRASIDHIVSDAIESGKAYSGFSASKTAATEITLSPGRLYAGGQVFARDENVVIDVFNSLPLVTKKRVAIVAFGQPVDTDVQPRDFLIDAQIGTTEPQSVAMENLRRAELSAVAGTEGPDPSYPPTDANTVVICYALLDTSGIVSIEQWSATQLPNLRVISNRTSALEVWRGQISGQVDTLKTDLAALADRLKLYTMKSDYVDLLVEFEKLRERVFQPSAYIFYGSNHFLDLVGSQTAHASFDAVVGEGIRFPNAGSATAALSLLNPNNPYVTVNNGFVLPKYSHGLRMNLAGYNGETRMAQYTFETTTVTQLARTRERRRFGPAKSVCTNSTYWRQGNYDPVTGVFRINGETWEVAAADRANATINHKFIRITQFWVDTYEEPYWDYVKSTSTLNGQQIAQTFLNSQDGWLSQVGLYFSRKAATGDVNVIVCETAYGMPDLSRVISRTVLPVASIQVGAAAANAALPALIETTVPIVPTYLKSGRRYAIVLVTTGDHYVAMTNTDNGVVQGTFFVSTDGAFFAGNLVSDMKMKLYFAKFDQPRVIVELSALQLAGGILDIDILNEGITPPACRLDYEVQVNGAWVPLDAPPNGPSLASLPAILPLRAVLTGTTDLMPGFGVTASQATVSRNKTAFTWVGTKRTLGSASTSIKIIIDLQAFDEVKHDCTVTLLTGTTLATTETADAVEDKIQSDGTVRRTCVFNVTSVSDYAVKIVGATVSAAETFHVAELIEFANT